jgi:hypothetical protein
MLTSLGETEVMFPGSIITGKYQAARNKHVNSVKGVQ